MGVAENMFGSLMRSGFLCLRNGSIVVTIEFYSIRGSCGDFALKFDRVNYVEVETINSWRLKIQEHPGIREVSRLLISPVKDSRVVFFG
ncbi:hypothetical protein V6N13_125059 [Hibiscus sabdariffa]